MSKEKNVSAFEFMAKRLKALANPTRLAIIHSLCEGEKNVTTLIKVTGFSQARISKHLRILREEALVVSRREHRKIFYSPSGNLPHRICELVLESLKNSTTNSRKIIESYRWKSNA